MKYCIHGRSEKQKCIKCELDIGDTFINFNDMPPCNQWDRIVDMLKENGFKIVKLKEHK